MITFISSLQQDSQGGTSAVAFAIGLFAAVWVASGAMRSVIKAVNRAYELQETRPFWHVRIVAILLVVMTGITTAGVFLLIVVGGALGDAISKTAHLGGAFNWTWGILRWPIAFCAILLFFALVYYLAPNKRVAQLEVDHARLGARRAALAWTVWAVRALRDVRGELLEDIRRARERDHPPALVELLRVRAALRCGAQLGARATGQMSAPPAARTPAW